MRSTYQNFLQSIFSIFIFSSISQAQHAPACSEMLSRINEALRSSQNNEPTVLQYNRVVTCTDLDIPTLYNSRWENKHYRAVLLERSDQCSLTPEECYGRGFQVPRLLSDAATVPHNNSNIHQLNFQNLFPDRYQNGFGFWGDHIPSKHISSSLPTSISPGSLWGNTKGSIRTSFQNDQRIGGQFREEFFRPLNTGENREYDIHDSSLFPKSSYGGVYFEGRSSFEGSCYGAGGPTRPGYCLYASRTYATYQTLVLFDLPEIPTPTPTFGPSVTPTATPIFTATPSPTPEEPCLSEEEVRSKTDELLFANRDGCSDGVIEDISNKISDLEKKACLKPRPKPDLRRGLFRMINHEQKTYSQWPACHEQILRAVLAGGYRLVGNPSQRGSTKEFLEDNNWDCKLRIKDQIHPYRLGDKSQHRNVVIAVSKDSKAKLPEYLFGVTEANKVLPVNYPLSLMSLGYKRTAIELFEDLSNERTIPHIGKITQKKYAEILKKIPRDKVSMYMYGVLPDAGNTAKTDHSSVALNNGVNRAYACFPPAENVVRDDSKCRDYSLENDCVEELARSEGLRKGGRNYLDDKKRVPFRMKAIAAAYEAGFRGELLIRMLKITEAETTQNYWVRNPVAPDDSYGLIQYNLRNYPKRRKKIIERWGSLDALFDPSKSLILGYEMSGGGALFKKSIGKVRNTWTTFCNQKYKNALRPVTSAVMQYYRWRASEGLATNYGEPLTVGNVECGKKVKGKK